MHPAKSVILFTTTSGAGYGLLMLVGLFDLLGVLPAAPTAAFLTIGPALVLVMVGLLSSTFHLGHPERAWRALTQWRSSWLSREGLLALWTFVPALLYLGDRSGLLPLPGVVANVSAFVMALSALATVYCTAMIYASLKPVHAWATSLTPLAYIANALATGGILLTAVASLLVFVRFPVWGLTLFFLGLALVVKLVYWARLQAPAPSTPETATGLGALGKVRLLEAPHTEQSYLLREMGFRIARRHAEKLRWIAILLGFLLPGFLIGLTFGFALGFPVLTWLAVLSGAVGIFAERWLFFAEARHTVTLYYGARTV